MDMQGSAAEQFKQRQQREWDDAALGWQKWGDKIEQSLTPVNEMMIRSTGLGPGHRVLDVGSGIGEPALTVARVVGPQGRVVATDIAPQLLEVAAQRAARAGLTNVEFQVMDAENLDFPAASFDVVLCRFALMLVPNAKAALAQMHRVLVRGGHFWAAVWGPPHRVPTIGVQMGVLMRQMQVPFPPPGAPSPFNLADPAHLRQLLVEAGFAGVHTEQLVITQEWPSTADAFAQVFDVAGPLKAMLGSLPATRQQEIRQAIAAEMRPFIQPDGRVITQDEVVVVIGQCED